jgi:hypothetical protein
MVADRVISSPARSARSPGRADEDASFSKGPGRAESAARSPAKAAVYVLDRSGCVEVRDWCKHQRLHQCRNQALAAHRALGGLPRRVTANEA